MRVFRQLLIILVSITSSRQRQALRKISPTVFEKLRKVAETHFTKTNKPEYAIDFDRQAELAQIPAHLRSPRGETLLIFSPLPPTISGISTFTLNLCNSLSNDFEIGLRRSFFTKGELSLREGFRSHLFEEKNSQHESLYMLGNGPHHVTTWKKLLIEPGFVFVHDARIPNIPVQQNEDKYWLDLTFEEKTEKYLGRLPLHTKGIITMSQETADIVRGQLTKQQLDAIPILLLSTGHPAKYIDLDKQKIQKKNTIATFGFIDNQKDPEQTIELISDIASRFNLQAVICGQISNQNKNAFKSTWKKSGNKLTDLEFKSGLNDEEFEKEIASSRIAIQLRKFSNGETSGLIPILASYGIPTVVSETGSFRELPDDLFFKVSASKKGSRSENYEQIVEKVSDLLASEEKYDERQQALISWSMNKSFDVAAMELAEFIRSRKTNA